jgi:hypothetical protein
MIFGDTNGATGLDGLMIFRITKPVLFMDGHKTDGSVQNDGKANPGYRLFI